MGHVTRALAHLSWWLSYNTAVPAERTAACRRVEPAERGRGASGTAEVRLHG